VFEPDKEDGLNYCNMRCIATFMDSLTNRELKKLRSTTTKSFFDMVVNHKQFEEYH